MLKLLGGHDPVDLGSPMLVDRVAWRGGVLLLGLKPKGADLHPSGRGESDSTLTVRCYLDDDPGRNLATLEMWRVNHLVVRAALEPEHDRLSLWRSRAQRVDLRMARSLSKAEASPPPRGRNST